MSTEMAHSPSISDLVAQISKNSSKVENYLHSNNLPMPSFLPDGPTNMAISEKDAEDARVAAISASMELLDLLQGPKSCLRPSVSSFVASCSAD